MSVADRSSTRARYLGPGEGANRACQHRRATATPGPGSPVPAHLSSRRAARCGAAQRRGAAAASSSSSPTARPSPSAAGRCRGHGHGPAERHDGQETPILRAEATAQHRARAGPGPPVRPRSPGHVRPPPPARASPRCRHPARAPTATSPGAPAAANRGLRRRTRPGGAPPSAAAEPNRADRPPAEPRPCGPVTNRTGARRRPQAAGGLVLLRPCSCVRPSPGYVTRRLSPARPIAARARPARRGPSPPAPSQSEAPK